MLLLCNNTEVKKQVVIDPNAVKELRSFTASVQARFAAIFAILAAEGLLKEPFAKKLAHDLFELRVRHNGQWRALYAYIDKQTIVILCAFNKKTQKTPAKEIHTAELRLRRYI